MFEFLLEPIVDTYFFGCPDSCIVPNSDTHEFLKILFTPLVLIGISIVAIIGSLSALGRMPNLESLRSIRLRGKSIEQVIKDLPEADEVVHGQHEPKTVKQLERAIRKNDKKEFLKNLKDDLNPERAFDKFLEFQDPDHPQTETLKAVRTEAKEQAKQELKQEEKKEPEVKMENDKEQEFYKENKDSLEKQAKQVAELMKSENLTEEEAIDKIIAQMPTEEEEVVEEKKEEEVKELDMDIDVFKQDIQPEEEPKHFKFFHTQFKKKKKKQKPRYRYKLTEVGTKRRDQYAKQIEYKLHEWCMPMPKYAGKNQEYQMEEGLLKTEIRKLSLFISMCEMMADKQKSKKNYWQKFKLVQ